MKRSTYIRLIADLVIFASIIWAPWWLVVIELVAGILFFPVYYEAILFGVIVDVIYGTSQSGFFGYNVKYTAGALILLVVYTPIKKRFRIN